MFICGGKGKAKWVTSSCRSIKRDVIKGKLIRVKKKKNTKIECKKLEKMSGLDTDNASDSSEIVELDPSGRYGRYNEILGKGASKTVYRAFDEYEGIEVAWNQVKLYDFLQSTQDLERLYCEIHLLKTLTHKNIMKFYTSWVDVANRKINFITEMFTSGTLKQYRQKYRRVDVRVVKNWCRQILSGLLYLHSHDPPVIHRDLKCDNIFVNGNQGEVKIGDLGLAAILKKSHAAHCVGTPEFMAPEVYEEAYNELVDIYSFGMCVLEMVTFEYPYSECTNTAHIYKKVVSGKKPDALYKVKDPALRQFVEKCLASASSRLSARELLNDPFLRSEGYDVDSRHKGYGEELDEMDLFVRQPLLEDHHYDDSFRNGHSNGFGFEAHKEWGYHRLENQSSGVELFENHDDENSADVDISIIGKRREDGGIFLRLRIADKEGRVRNIHFPFDIGADTAFSVTTEMVTELDITDQDVTKIANMIDREIASLVPQWKPGPGIEKTPGHGDQSLCYNCDSNQTSYVSLVDFTTTNPDCNNLQFMQCCSPGCSSTRGRFEEITFKTDESEHLVKKGADKVLNQLDCLRYQEIKDHHGRKEPSSDDSSHIYSDEYYDTLQSLPSTDEELKSGCNRASNAVYLNQNFPGSHSSIAVPAFYNQLPVDYKK